MILVDSSIWIDQLAGRMTPQTEAFERLVLGDQALGVGDLMVVEVLQGTRDDRGFAMARALFAGFDRIVVSDHRIADEAARLSQTLRAKGVTVRKTIDTLIATRCVLDDMPLLYADRDFDPFVRHCGLQSALDFPGAS